MNRLIVTSLLCAALLACQAQTDSPGKTQPSAMSAAQSPPTEVVTSAADSSLRPSRAASVAAPQPKAETPEPAPQLAAATPAAPAVDPDRQEQAPLEEEGRVQAVGQAPIRDRGAVAAAEPVDAGAPNTKSAPMQQLGLAPMPMAFEAAAFFQDYTEMDRLTARSKYAGKQVKISGQVERILHMDNETMLWMTAGSDARVSASFADMGLALAREQIAENGMATIVCSVGGQVNETVQLVDCELSSSAR
jgi:hypothetical protein